MDLVYFDIEGWVTATADVNINADAALSAARSMQATSAALGQHGFSLAASATLNATMSYYDATMEFAWNLSVMLELSVATDAMALHMRAEYNKPCAELGVSASGTLQLSVPGAIEIENAAIGGTLYCEGAEPRVEAYIALESMVLADVIEIQRVRLDLRSVNPANATGDLSSLDWKIGVAGTMRFDKLLAKIPSVSSAGTVLEVDAKLSLTAGVATLDSLIVHFVFDVTYQAGGLGLWHVENTDSTEVVFLLLLLRAYA